MPSIIYYSNRILSYFIDHIEGYFISSKKIIHDINRDVYINTNLVIVAHPDDDILWFGEFLIKNSSNTKVLCITSANNDIRSKEFIKVMTALNISYEMWDYIDSKTHIGSLQLEEELKTICEKFDNIYTHSSCGETGHPQHIMLHDYIFKISKEKLYIFTPNSWFRDIITDKKNELLSLYKSQTHVITQHIYLSMRENHNKYI